MRTWEFAPTEGQIESDYHSQQQYHVIPYGTEFVGQGSVLMKNNDLKDTSKLCQMYVKSIGTARLSTDILAGAIRRLKSNWTGKELDW